MKLLWELFFNFFKMGLFTFGGGYAMLPLLQREIVDKKGWTTEEELLDYYAIGQAVPGIIAVNTANFVGYKQKGKPGALAAVLGLLAPSMLIIMLIFSFLTRYAELGIVQHAFSGIRIAVSALVIQAVYMMAKKGVIDRFTTLLFIASIVLIIVLKLNPAYVVLAGGLLGALRRSS